MHMFICKSSSVFIISEPHLTNDRAEPALFGKGKSADDYETGK